MKLLGCLLFLFLGQENDIHPDEFVNVEKFAGAWVSHGDDIDGPLTRILIASDNYFAIAAYRTKDNSFISTSGGSYEIKQGMMEVTIAYNSLNQHQAGKWYLLQTKKTDNGYKLVAKNGMVLGDWERLDYGNEGELAGFWETVPSQQVSSVDKAGRTVKIFSSGYFQWITFDTGKIRATAGGKYKFSGDRYIEQINFYSLDKQKVGKEVIFSSRFEGAKWICAGADLGDRTILETWVRK